MSGLFHIIRIPFGFLIKWLYNLCNNYFVAILIFSILLKLIMVPFGIKQQKNSQKQASLRPKENIIRKLTSRKLWVAVAGFVSGLIVAFDGDAEVAETVSGLILQGAAVIGYLIAEGLADSAHAE